MSTYLQELDFHQSQADNSLHILWQGTTIIFFLTYVNDILLTGNNKDHISTIIQKLHQKFQMKELGSLITFIGIQAIPLSSGYILTQQAYVHTIHHRVGMSDNHPTSTPTTIKHSPSIDD